MAWKKLKKFEDWNVGLMGILVIFFLLLGIYLGANYGFKSNLSEIKCERNDITWAMWNNKTATELGITSEMMINITYAYLWDYEIRCPKNVQDCFIDVPSNLCWITDSKAMNIYTRNIPLEKVNKTKQGV